MKINETGLDLIAQFEGCRLTAYRCPGNVLTIGYGHTSAAGAPRVFEGMTITEDRARLILENDVEAFSEAVAALVTRPINENQFAAFVSLAFNIGVGAFKKSTALRKFNAGDVAGAADAITLFNKSGGKVLRGLVRRREVERQLFNTPVVAEVDEVGRINNVTGGEAKPLAKSKTVGLGAGAGVATILPMISQIRDTLPELAEYMPYIALVLFALIIFNRWNDSRRGIH